MACYGKELLKNLAGRFSLDFTEFRTRSHLVIAVGPELGSDEEVYDVLNFEITSNKQASAETDRFLKVEVGAQVISVSTDYAGTVPGYVGRISGFLLTNIFPAALKATSFNEHSISPPALYNLMKYGHTVAGETSSANVNVLYPDHKYQFLLDGSFISCTGSPITDNPPSPNRSENVAELRELNCGLVHSALEPHDQIILPLSSGYDSRLILAAISDSSALKKKTLATTYGPANSMEVVAGKELASAAGVEWLHVDLECNFLGLDYLKDIALIFGSSLHMHGMYQLEFFDALKNRGLISSGAVLTSGFMTGVPAGQHVRDLSKNRNPDKFGKSFLSSFSQSKYWQDGVLEKAFETAFPGSVDEASKYVEDMEKIIGRSDYQGQILFDLWTRQRNFISYYPRTLEWKIAVVSPHMNRTWLEYFYTLSDNQLKNRKHVAEMFNAYYPALARIPSNSSQFSRLGNPFRSAALLASRALFRAGIPNLFPRKFQDAPILFDRIAINKVGALSIFPIREMQRHSLTGGSLNTLIGNFSSEMSNAENGSIDAYNRLVGLQSLGWDLEY